MAFDWSLVVGAAVGATLGLVGDWSGRLGAGRQAERARQAAIEDAAREREWRIEEQRIRDFDARQTRLIEDLLTRVTNLSTPPDVDVNSSEYRQRVFTLCDALGYQAPQLADAGLRRRAELALWALDARFSPSVAIDFTDYSAWEVVYTIRVGLTASLSAKLRGEARLPELSPDWDRIAASATEAMEAWRSTKQREGFNADP